MELVPTWDDLVGYLRNTEPNNTSPTTRRRPLSAQYDTVLRASRGGPRRANLLPLRGTGEGRLPPLGQRGRNGGRAFWAPPPPPFGSRKSPPRKPRPKPRSNSSAPFSSPPRPPDRPMARRLQYGVGLLFSFFPPFSSFFTLDIDSHQDSHQLAKGRSPVPGGSPSFYAT